MSEHFNGEKILNGANLEKFQPMVDLFVRKQTKN